MDSGRGDMKVKSLSRIREIIWIPSITTLYEADLEEFHCDDDHFASKLAEHGLLVHTVQPKQIEKSSLALMEAVNWRIQEGKALGRQIAIIGQELSVVHVLNYISEIALPMSTNRVDIGAVVLIDPFSLQNLRSREGRKAVLSKYVEPFLSPPLLDEFDVILFPKSAVADVKKSRKKKKKKDRLAPSDLNTSLNDEKCDRNQAQYLLKRWKKLGPLGETLISLTAEKLRERARDQLVGADAEDLIEKDGENLEELVDLSTNLDFELEIYEQTTLQKSSSAIEPSILGKFPVRITETATALKNRMLIISSEFEDPSASMTMFPSSGFNSAWNAESVEELAFLYQAGPVIYLRSQESTEVIDSTREILPSIEVSNLSKDADLVTFSETGQALSQRDSRHHLLFDVISCWLSMLAQFQYI